MFICCRLAGTLRRPQTAAEGRKLALAEVAMTGWQPQKILMNGGGGKLDPFS